MLRDQRRRRSPHRIDHPRRTREHDQYLHPLVVTGTAPGSSPGHHNDGWIFNNWYPLARALSAVSFHPGNIATNFANDAGVPLVFRVAYRTPLRRVLRSPERGAQTLVWLSESTPRTDWIPGEYYDGRKPGRANAQAADATLAEQLWNRSGAMLGRG
jgi:hypothetical protein